MEPDFRLADYPVDSDGRPLFDEGDFDNYVSWLSDHLRSVTLSPAPQQEALCRGLTSVAPGVAMRRMGIDLGIEDALDGLPDDDFLDDEFDDSSSTGIGMDLDWQYDVDVPVDVGYRVPLALVLRPIEAAAERVKLLKEFFNTYHDESLK